MNDKLVALTTEIRSRVAGLGYELVDVRKRGSSRRVHLQLRVDRPHAAPAPAPGPGSGITVAECASVSRALEAWLDEDQRFGPRYVLEVSSPGIERPVRWPEHWARYVGHDVNVRIAGRGRLRATIVEVVDGQDAVVLRPVGKDEELTVRFSDTSDATLAVDWSEIDRLASRRTRSKTDKE